MSSSTKTIGILTGGGDVPGLNPAIRAVTFRAIREGYKVLGIRRGWAGLIDLVRDKDAENSQKDQYGHKKLGGIGDKVAERLKKLSPKYNDGRRVNTVNQRLGYLVRCGEPDAIDSIVPMAYGNLALDMVLTDRTGTLVCVRNGCYQTAPLEVVTSEKKVVDVERFYNPERLRPKYETVSGKPLFIMTSEG